VTPPVFSQVTLSTSRTAPTSYTLPDSSTSPAGSSKSQRPNVFAKCVIGSEHPTASQTTRVRLTGLRSFVRVIYLSRASRWRTGMRNIDAANAELCSQRRARHADGCTPHSMQRPHSPMSYSIGMRLTWSKASRTTLVSPLERRGRRIMKWSS